MTQEAYQLESGRWVVEVTRDRIRCPQCQSTSHTQQRGRRPNGDGTTCQRRVCHDCYASFDVVETEPVPKIGKPSEGPD